jgi:hypothetical protein
MYASQVESAYQKYKDQGLLSITIVAGESQAGAARWADSFDQTGVVVADPNFEDGVNWYPFAYPPGGSSVGYPGMVLIDHGMVIYSKSRPPSDSEMQAALNN